MQTYEIYLVVEGCDSEWQHLGDVQASNADEAIVQARTRWPEHEEETLAALTASSLVYWKHLLKA